MLRDGASLSLVLQLSNCRTPLLNERGTSSSHTGRQPIEWPRRGYGGWQPGGVDGTVTLAWRVGGRGGSEAAAALYPVPCTLGGRGGSEAAAQLDGALAEPEDRVVVREAIGAVPREGRAQELALLAQRHHMFMADLGKLGGQLRKLLEDVVPHGEGWVGQHLCACMRACMVKDGQGSTYMYPCMWVYAW